MQSLDWQAVEQKLFEQGKNVIEQFAREHIGLSCSFFACIANPFSGDFGFGFDTPANAAYEAMRQELVVIRHRQAAKKQSGRTDAWKNARSFIDLPLPSYPWDTEFFQYPLYTKFSLNWSLSTGSNSNVNREEGQDSYLEGHTRLAIHNALDKLIAERAFICLLMTAPFRVGYQFHDETVVVLRFLNWPLPDGQTIYSVLDSPLAQRSQPTNSSLHPLKQKIHQEDV